MITVTLDYRRLSSAAGAVRVAATAIQDRTLLAAGSLIVVRHLQAEAPTKTGRLRGSIVAKDESGGVGFYSVRYGRYVNDGTRPHTIIPRTARVLVFQVGGKTVFARQVNHPGTKANPFVRRALDASTDELKVLMLENGRRLVGAIVRDSQ